MNCPFKILTAPRSIWISLEQSWLTFIRISHTPLITHEEYWPEEQHGTRRCWAEELWSTCRWTGGRSYAAARLLRDRSPGEEHMVWTVSSSGNCHRKKKKKKKCSSSALPSLSDLQFPERPVCGWRDTPWHRRITPWWPAWRSAFLSNVKQKRKEMYKNVKLRHMNKPSNCEFKKVKILP